MLRDIFVDGASTPPQRGGEFCSPQNLSLMWLFLSRVGIGWILNPVEHLPDPVITHLEKDPELRLLACGEQGIHAANELLLVGQNVGFGRVELANPSLRFFVGAALN